MLSLLSFDFYMFSLEVLVPIFVCVVLPCTIVWIVIAGRRHEADRRTEVALKAIEAGQPVDSDVFCKKKNENTEAQGIKERIFGNLKKGLILLAIGLALLLPGLCGMDDLNESWLICTGAILTLMGAAFITVYFIGRKHFAKEIEKEEKDA